MRRMKKFLVLVLALVLAFCLCACEKGGKGKEAAANKPTEDRSGASISLPNRVEKIVVLAPSIAETLIDLGCSDMIVGVDTQTMWNGYESLSADLPAFDMMAPDNEQIAALKPDLVFVSGMTDIAGTDLYGPLKDMEICVACIPSSESLQGIRDDITFIASCVDKVKEGEKIIADFDAEIERITALGDEITDKKTVYFEIAAAPYAYSFGENTYLDEMLDIIGAENVLADQEGWLPVELESVVAENPDVILTNVNYIDDAVGEILTRDGFSNVTAVENQAVYYIDSNSSTLPNENIVKALDEMAKAIYPDVYGK